MTIRKQRGFTLIELLVVIAIIGILSSVVLASLNSAREKSRDARRIADVRQLQLALELYFDSNGEYPDALGNLASSSAGFISVVPVDPTDDTAYEYNAYTSTSIGSGADCTESSETCVFYHLGASLEDGNHSALDTDVDTTGDVVDGPDGDGCSDEPDRACYDVTP